MALTADTASFDFRFDEAKGRMADFYAPCLTLALKLRAANEYGDAEVLRGRIKRMLEASRREAGRHGAPPEDAREVEFALVAFLDETLLSSDWSQKDRWLARPLQLELYNRYDAGEEFFHRLDGLRANPGLHAEVLEVYYLCMALGFKGKYQLHGQEELRELIEGTYAEVAKQPGMKAGRLAPHGPPRDNVATEVRGRVPTWVLVAAALVIGLVVYLGMSLYISNTADTMAEDIDRVAEVEAVR
jgi:type VI secretion system protein ImpK